MVARCQSISLELERHIQHDLCVLFTLRRVLLWFVVGRFYPYHSHYFIPPPPPPTPSEVASKNMDE